MNRKETIKFLSELVEKLINPTEDSRIYWAREVTFDYATSHRVRVDYMKFEPVNNSISGIEKAISIATKLSHRLKISTHPMGIIFLEISTITLCPKKSMIRSELESHTASGVYCPDETRLHSVRNARRRSRERPVLEMLLMMFRSANRDRM